MVKESNVATSHHQKAISYKALNWILAPEPETSEIPVALVEDLLLSPNYSCATYPNLWLRRSLVVKPELVCAVGKLTTGQRQNHIWAAVRKMRFTASNFGPILTGICNNRFVK